MEKEIDRLHTKLDKLDERLDTIDTHLAVYNEQLKVHIKRTDLLELDVRPIKKHVQNVNFSFKALGFLATLATILTFIYQYIG